VHAVDREVASVEVAEAAAEVDSVVVAVVAVEVSAVVTVSFIYFPIYQFKVNTIFYGVFIYYYE
jgi:hypothetical protein